MPGQALQLLWSLVTSSLGNDFEEGSRFVKFDLAEGGQGSLGRPISILPRVLEVLGVCQIFCERGGGRALTSRNATCRSWSLASSLAACSWSHLDCTRMITNTSLEASRCQAGLAVTRPRLYYKDKDDDDHHKDLTMSRLAAHPCLVKLSHCPV